MNATLLTKSELAERILVALLEHGGCNRVRCQEAFETGRKLKVSRSTMRRAAQTMGLRAKKNGPHPAVWVLSVEEAA